MNKIKTTATKRLTDFDFSATGAHVALVGEAANGRTVLLTKSAKDAEVVLEEVKKEAEVAVVLSFEEYLMTFFGLYRYDASALALLLGYESAILDEEIVDAEKYDDTWGLESIAQKLNGVALLKSADLALPTQVELLENQVAFEKSMKEATVSMRLDDFLEAFGSVEEAEQEESFYHFEQRAEGLVAVTNEPYLDQRINSMDFVKSVTVQNFDELEEPKKLMFKAFQLFVEKDLLTGDEPISKQEDKSPVNGELTNNPLEEGNTMSEKATQEDILKQLADQGEILKSMQAERDALRAEKEESIEKAFVLKAAEFSFVGEEEAPAIGKLLKSIDAETSVALLKAFAAAEEAIAVKKDAEESVDEDMLVQKSVSGESEAASPDADRLEAVNKALNIKQVK